MSLTPHGPSFSFLDHFEVIVPGKEGRGRKWLDPKLPFFADHFPGNPVMPGVLLIECAAQSSGALWASLSPTEDSRAFILAQVVQFKIQQPVLPQETVETTVSLEKSFGTLARFDVVLRVRDVQVAQGQIVMARA